MNEKKEFSTKYSIDYHGLTSELTITPQRLIDYLQESAVRHSEWAGYPMTWFRDNMRGWLITNWDLKIKRYPKWNEEINVKTWPVLFKGILGYRGFEIIGENNTQILLGMSQWVYTDLEKRRPVKPQDDMCKSYGIIKPAPFEKDFSFPSKEKFCKISSNNVSVSRRDIDTNYHVNNVVYIEWFMDFVPDSIYNNMKPYAIKVYYKKECTLGDEILIELYQDKNNILAEISKDNTLLTQIYTEWN